MAFDGLRLIEHVHGHLGWLAAALLVHPAIVLRRAERRADVAVGLASAGVTVVALLGAWLYVSYRERLRQGIFASAPSIGLLFERKEHLAFAAVLLAWAGAAAYYGERRADPATRVVLRRVAFRAFVAASALALLVAAFGTVVAVYRSF